LALHNPPLEIPFLDENGFVNKQWADWLYIAKRDKANRLEDSTAGNISILTSDGNYEDGGSSLSSVTDVVDNFAELDSTRIVASNEGSLQEVDLEDWIDGTEDQITVTDDGDGTVTLSTPQDLATDSAPTFDHLHVSTAYHAYGGFQNKSQSITCAVQNTWYHITNGTNDLWTGTEAQGMSLSGDVLTITNAGDYSGSLSMTLSGLNGKDFHIRLYNITQTAQAGYIQGVSTTGATNFTNVTLPLYIEASAGDTFRMEVQCTTAAVGNPTFEHAVFYLQYLHD